MAIIEHESLKELHRQRRDQLSDALNLRIHRALSWIRRAQACEDADGRFVFLWIAFNAAYAQEIPSSHKLSEQEAFQHFVDKLAELDSDKLLGNLLWQEFSGPIRVLLDNPYVFESFWSFQRGEIEEAEWQRRLAAGKRSAGHLIAQGDTPKLLALVLQRIYTLRNQLMHGGATWNGGLNRAQVTDCVRLMEKLVPTMLTIMMNSRPDSVWGDACYPPVSGS